MQSPLGTPPSHILVLTDPLRMGTWKQQASICYWKYQRCHAVNLLLHPASFTDQKSPSQVPPWLLCNPPGQFWRQAKWLLLTCLLQYGTDLTPPKEQHYKWYHDILQTLSFPTSSKDGAATLSPRHLLLIAGMTLLVELQHKINLQLAMYFSMVRRRACWASFVRRSTSVSTTTATQCVCMCVHVCIYVNTAVNADTRWCIIILIKCSNTSLWRVYEDPFVSSNNFSNRNLVLNIHGNYSK